MGAFEPPHKHMLLELQTGNHHEFLESKSLRSFQSLTRQLHAIDFTEARAD